MKFSLSFYHDTIRVILLVSGGDKLAKYTLVFEDGTEIGGTCEGMAAATAHAVNVASATVGQPLGYMFADRR